jgi:hypothetical protein
MVVGKMMFPQQPIRIGPTIQWLNTLFLNVLYNRSHPEE